nr:MAG TPA: hypothetical protein [Caudoviricetes sp.]
MHLTTSRGKSACPLQRNSRQSITSTSVKRWERPKKPPQR